MRSFFSILLFVSFTFAIHNANSAPPTEVVVAHVIDGDTFITEDGHHVRLIGINTPERANKERAIPAEPFSAEAKAFLKQLIEGKSLKLSYETLHTDRYKRLLAHAYLPNGSWVNGQIIQAGMGHLYSFPDNREKIAALATLENKARQNKTGLWQHKKWEILDADHPLPDESIGHFRVIEGRVLHTAKARGTVYLNFGPDWRTDFSVEIRPEDIPRFKADNINPQTAYKGQKVRIRGIIKPVNGWLVTATHPEQIIKIQ